ncbi:fatty-acyl-CoA synthase [Pseudomonas sp. TE3610]
MAVLYMSETSSIHSIPMRHADFASLVEALDYAATSNAGMNFYDRRSQLVSSFEYRMLKRRALMGARRLRGLGLVRGDRVALIADTSATFVEVFFACQYAGLIPVPLPIPMGVGQHASYVEKLRGLLSSCSPAAVCGGEDWLPLVREAAVGLPPMSLLSGADIDALPEAEVELQAPQPDDIAYLQYTSGSTRFPRGVVITQRAVMANLQVISRDGIRLREGDRCVSWLPFYHDMGLVGFVLTPVATQLSVDYLRTQDFAMRPLQWLKLISRNRGTVSVAPPFGYNLCLRRCNDKDLAELDLTSWRVAGVGAEPVPFEALTQFAERFAAVGFGTDTFMPCFGLAESTLAVSFADASRGLRADVIDRDVLERRGQAVPATAQTRAVSTFVNCGPALPGHRIDIRNAQGKALAEREVGQILIAGPSLMSGYFRDPESHLQAGQWLDTGDLGYLLDGDLHVTGRKKDLIIIRGRNIWPQDIEHVAEGEPDVRPGDAIAFVTARDDEPVVVMQIQCRVTSPASREHLVRSLSGRIQSEFGVSVDIQLVPPQSIPRTSSGKPARAEAKRRYLSMLDALALPTVAIA